MAERAQDGRPVVPQPWQLLETCPTCAPLRLRLTYLWSLHCALVVAMPSVTPRAVAVTLEQLLACADCGAKLKATIAPSAIAANNNLVIAPLLLGDRFLKRPSELLDSPRLVCWLRLFDPLGTFSAALQCGSVRDFSSPQRHPLGFCKYGALR